MNHYNYHNRLKAIWSEAVAKYQSGNREPDSYFDPATLADLTAIGLNSMDVYDYAEDFVSRDEPDFETFLMVAEVRRDFFFSIQKARLSDHRIDSATLPPKDLALRGIVYLPRIIAKALAKLRGELPPETMYGCGGDRDFFKSNQIHPAEFLRVIWAYHDDDDKIIDWVLARRSKSPS